MEKYLVAVILFLFILPHPVTLQESLVDGPTFGVHKIYPPLSLTREQLNSAKSLEDLHKQYPSSWIREYRSIEIVTVHSGKTTKAFGKDELLTSEQKAKLNQADFGSVISVHVEYLPENTLKNNEIKVFDFTFTINPEYDAQFPGGTTQLIRYLQEAAIDKIPVGTFQDYDMTAVKFTIDESGQITNPHVFWSFHNEAVDDLLLKTLSTMPNWEPAKFADGTKTNQEFVFIVGNMENCAVNLLGIQ